MNLVDSHCHLNLLDLSSGDTVDEVILRAQQQGVRYFLNVCVSLADYPEVLATAEDYDQVGASVGLHPNSEEELSVEELVRLAKHDKVVALGETGLDYYRSTGDLEWQREHFRMHIRAAREVGKPLIIHTREASDDTIRIMREEKANEVGGVMHCFTEAWDVAEKALELGFYISFSGIVTFKNAHTIQDTASKVPLDRILVETDAPYLAPVPYRGKQNEPAYVRYTAAYIAEMRGLKPEQLADITTENFYRLFKGARRYDV